MQEAANLYIEVQSVTSEPADPWDMISSWMVFCGAKEAWTPNKVNYAWHHGARTILESITIECQADG